MFHVVRDKKVLWEFDHPLPGLRVDVDIGDQIFGHMLGARNSYGVVDLLHLAADSAQIFRSRVNRRGGLLSRNRSRGQEEEGDQSFHLPRRLYPISTG